MVPRRKKWRKLVYWWITGKQGFRLCLTMCPVTSHCQQLVSLQEKQVSPLLPITNLSVCHVGAHAAFKVNQRSWFDAPLLQQHTFSQNHVSNGVCDLNCCNCLCLCMIGQSKWEINILSSLAAKEADRVDLIWLDFSALSFTAIIHSQRIWGQSSRTTSLQ